MQGALYKNPLRVTIILGVAELEFRRSPIALCFPVVACSAQTFFKRCMHFHGVTQVFLTCRLPWGHACINNMECMTYPILGRSILLMFAINSLYIYID